MFSMARCTAARLQYAHEYLGQASRALLYASRAASRSPYQAVVAHE